MAQKSETPALLLAFLVTTGLIGGGAWWLAQRSGTDLGNLISSVFNSNPNSPSNPIPTINSGDVVATFAAVQNVPRGLFNYGGSTSWAPIRKDVDAQIQAELPEFQLRYTDPVNATPGSGSGIRMLLDGQLAFSQSSRPVEDREYEQAKQRGFSLRPVPIAMEAIAIAAHPTLPVAGLTLKQLQAIYTGQITNWKQVGGTDLPITPYSRRPEDGGTVEFFISNVLGGQPLGGNVKFVYSTTDALRQVGSDRGGIYYASAPEVVPQCSVKPLAIAREANQFVAPYKEPLVAAAACPGQRNQLNLDAFKSGNYPITRQLFVIVKQNGQTEQQAGEAYVNLLLTNQGQKLLLDTGFVGIR